MINIELQSYKIKELKMANNLKINRNIHLINRNNFGMEFVDNRKVTAVLTEYVRTQEDNEFYMELAIEGMFCLEGIEDTESWKEAHIRCYDKLFPYVKPIMELLAANSGLTGFVLEKKKIKVSDVCAGLEKEEKYSGRIIELPVFLN